MTSFTYPDGTKSQITYKNLDMQLTKDRLGRWTQYFYNSLRQPVSVIDAMGHVTTSNWTLAAGLGSVIDASGHVTTWKHDNQNRVTEKDYPDATKVQIAYENTTSRIKTVTDANGNVATTTYNQDNTVAQTAYTAGSGVAATPTVSATYDPIYPRIKTLVDGTGTTTTTYNPVYVSGAAITGGGRVGSVAMPLATVSYTYDELGRQLSQKVNDSATGQGLTDSTASATYDTLGRVATAASPLGSFTYAYLNNTGRVASVTNPNGQKAVYTYQDSTTTPNEPRLTEITNQTAAAAVISKFDYLYDAQGQITSWTQQTDTNHPQKWALQYDNEGKLINANVTDTTTSAMLHQYAYTFDPAGNRTSEQIDGNIVSSSYNNLNQLTGKSAGGAMVFSGSMNKAGSVTVGGHSAAVDVTNIFRGTANVTTGTNVVAVVATNLNGYAVTNKFQVVVPSSASSYTYDLNGNLTSDGSRTFQYDAKNELVKITYADTSSTAFTYNGAGGRVKIQEYNASHTLTSTKQYVAGEERDATNKVTKRYFAQGEQRISGATATGYFYTRDHLGSIREMIDSSGTIQARYSYDPFGRRTKVSGSLDCDLGFTGYYHHAVSGLDLSPTRPYDSNTGRFIQRDRRGEGAGLNLYAYCGNNPINYVDLLGFDRTDAQRAVQFAHGLVGIGVAALAVGALVGSLSLVAVASPIIVGGAVVISAVTIAAAGIYGLANMAAAFSPNTPEGDQMSKTAADLPASADELTSKIITGSNDVGKTIDSISTVLTGEAADRLLDAIDDVLDQIDDQLNDSNSPSGGGSGGGCIDSPPMTAPPMGLTPDGLRP